MFLSHLLILNQLLLKALIDLKVVESLEEITKDYADEDFPLTGKNIYGESLFIFKGESDGKRFFKVTTFQHNDWCRIKVYWEDGTVEEMYEK